MLSDESSLTFKMMCYVNIVVTNAPWTCPGGHLLKEGRMWQLGVWSFHVVVCWSVTILEHNNIFVYVGCAIMALTC